MLLTCFAFVKYFELFWSAAIRKFEGNLIVFLYCRHLWKWINSINKRSRCSLNLFYERWIDWNYRSALHLAQIRNQHKSSIPHLPQTWISRSPPSFRLKSILLPEQDSRMFRTPTSVHLPQVPGCTHRTLTQKRADLLREATPDRPQLQTLRIYIVIVKSSSVPAVWLCTLLHTINCSVIHQAALVRRSEGTFSLPRQAATSLPQTKEASHCPFKCWTSSREAWIPIFKVFGLSRPKSNPCLPFQ